MDRIKGHLKERSLVIDVVFFTSTSMFQKEKKSSLYCTAKKYVSDRQSRGRAAGW